MASFTSRTRGRSDNMSVPSSSSDIPLAQRAAPIANGTQARTASEMRELDVDFAQDDSSVAGAYPRVDGGREAWLFLAGAFTIEMLVWGFAFTFGIWQEYYENHATFGAGAGIATVGTTQSGIMYISSPITFGALLRWPYLQRYATFAGLFLLCLSLACSSFAEKTSQLIATQGVMYAIGGGLVYAPSILYLDGWFVKRKGLAYGIMWAGTGLAGLVFPLVISACLNRFGHRATLRGLSVALFLMSFPLLHFMKPRIPPAPDSGRRRFDLTWLWSPTFLIFQLANILQGLGYFLPQIYLPTYASLMENHAGGDLDFRSTLTLVLFNVASVVGCIAMGFITDKLHITTCIAISALGTALGVFLFWGFSGASSGLSLLYVFCVAYGLFAGGYSSAWPGIIRKVLEKNEQRPDSMLVFGFLAAGRGIGNVAAGPFSEAILRHTEVGGMSRFGYSSEYMPLIVITGITALLGGASIMGRLKPGLV